MNDLGCIEPRVRMGEVMELLGLTARAIRFYEERGLVAPQRDRLGRRVFDLHARSRLEMIVKLRRAGLGIEDIQALLDRPRSPAWRAQALASLSRKRDELVRQLAELQAVEAWLTPCDGAEVGSSTVTALGPLHVARGKPSPSQRRSK